MTGQLGRVHALLAAGNVPCEMKRLPDGGPVLVAGTPTSPRWDVLIWGTDGDLFVQHKGAIDRLPAAADQAIADAIKFRVVQSWADQGDPQAKALLSAIGDRISAAEPAESAAGGYPRPRVRPGRSAGRCAASPHRYRRGDSRSGSPTADPATASPPHLRGSGDWGRPPSPTITSGCSARSATPSRRPRRTSGVEPRQQRGPVVRPTMFR